MVKVFSKSRRRSWYSIAEFLALAAFAFQMVHKGYIGIFVTKMAESTAAFHSAKKSLELGMDDLAQWEVDKSGTLKQLARQSLDRASSWFFASLGAFSLAVACWGVSCYRREGGSLLLPVILLISYIGILMVMVWLPKDW
jgi:hypothetical protein